MHSSEPFFEMLPPSRVESILRNEIAQLEQEAERLRGVVELMESGHAPYTEDFSSFPQCRADKEHWPCNAMKPLMPRGSSND